MKPVVLFRIAAVIFVLFAMGHTIGFLTFKPPTAEGLAVRDSMKNVSFTVQGSTFSYGRFYEGFGLSATVSMLFQAFLAWQLGSLAAAGVNGLRPIAWAFCAVQVVGCALSWIYFSIVPASFSLLLVAILGWAAWRL
jgi:hypothetical protein